MLQQRLPPTVGRGLRPGLPRRSLLLLGAGKTTSGRKTTSGTGSSKTTSGSKKGAGSPPPTRPRAASSARNPATSTPAPKTPRQRGKQRPSLAQEALSRVGDGTLILGDIVMIAATEASSERIPLADLPLLAGVTIGTWFAAAVALGDYKSFPPTSDNWYLSLLGPVFMAVVDATLTWGVAVVASCAIFSALIATNHLDAAPLLDGIDTDNLSPQLEAAVAALITMACWRGIAARLRTT